MGTKVLTCVGEEIFLVDNHLNYIRIYTKQFELSGCMLLAIFRNPDSLNNTTANRQGATYIAAEKLDAARSVLPGVE